MRGHVNFDEGQSIVDLHIVEKTRKRRKKKRKKREKRRERKKKKEEITAAVFSHPS